MRNKGHYALKRGLDIGLIISDDIYFSTDDMVWNTLCNSNDDIIRPHFFRGINPWIRIDTGFVRLTELDNEFKKEYERVQDQVSRGWGVRYNRSDEVFSHA